MQPDDPQRHDSRSSSLAPLAMAIAAPPEVVCVALLRYASTLSAAATPAASPAHTAHGRWAAHQLEGENVVIYTLREGSPDSLVLRFSAQLDSAGSTLLVVTGTYDLRKSRLRRAFERWQAHRDAVSLRDKALAAVNVLVDEQMRDSGPALRQAARKHVRASARLQVGERTWRGEVLDVSEGGMALVILCPPADAHADATFMLAEEAGEVEITLPGSKQRLAVTIRRAYPGRGGIQVGLQVLDPAKIRPLVRKAFATMQTNPP